jgi:hypothetical protein
MKTTLADRRRYDVHDRRLDPVLCRYTGARCLDAVAGYREFDETTLRSGGSLLIADSMYSISRAN